MTHVQTEMDVAFDRDPKSGSDSSSYITRGKIIACTIIYDRILAWFIVCVVVSHYSEHLLMPRSPENFHLTTLYIELDFNNATKSNCFVVGTLVHFQAGTKKIVSRVTRLTWIILACRLPIKMKFSKHRIENSLSVEENSLTKRDVYSVLQPNWNSGFNKKENKSNWESDTVL